MATISKFYFHDAATPNTGTMPTGAFATIGPDTTGDATGARTARDATDVIGAAQTSASFTAQANTSVQRWGFRRFVSRPLAAQTILFGSAASWTCAGARSESNTNHNQGITVTAYCWRPSTGAIVGTTTNNRVAFTPLAPASTAELTFSVGGSVGGTDLAISDGDILVFEVSDQFTQSMATAYTSSFFYDGTTEGSTTNNAAFITPPLALTLFTASASASLVAGTPQRSLSHRHNTMDRWN